MGAGQSAAQLERDVQWGRDALRAQRGLESKSLGPARRVPDVTTCKCKNSASYTRAAADAFSNETSHAGQDAGVE